MILKHPAAQQTGDTSGNHYLKSCCFILSNLIMPRPRCAQSALSVSDKVWRAIRAAPAVGTIFSFAAFPVGNMTVKSSSSSDCPGCGPVSERRREGRRRRR